MLAALGVRFGQGAALALIMAGGFNPALAETASLDEFGRTPLLGKIWCSAALSHFLARGAFESAVPAFAPEDARAAIVYYDDLTAEFAESGGLSIRDTIAMLSADRRRFIAEIEAPESDPEQVKTGLVACVAIAKFSGDPLFDLGFGLVFE